MDRSEYNSAATLMEEYIGDDLTVEDLQEGYFAFLEDEESESSDLPEEQ